MHTTANNQFAYIGYNGSNYESFFEGITYTPDMRANIFYDRNNTGYYVDPASTSRMSAIDFGSSGYYISNGSWGMRNTTPYGYIEFGPANSSWCHIYASHSFYFNQPLHYVGNRILNQDEWIGSKYLASDGRIYGTIFYDANDSGYYCDPNSTSRFSVCMPNYNRRPDHHLGHLEGSYNNIGANDAKSNPIYTIGYNYNPTATSLSNMYGIGYSHSNFYGNNGGATDWGLYVCAAGSYSAIIAHNGAWFRQNVTAYSDIRVKTNIQRIENAVDKVKQLNGYTYDRTDNPEVGRQTGVIAQEVLKVLPEAVGGSEESHYSVAYGNMVGLLIEAIKEQQEYIESQQNQIDELKSLVATLVDKLK
jgi:hypothetical protein